MGEHMPPTQSSWVMGIAEIWGEKIGRGGVRGYRIILAKEITLKYVF